MKAREESHQGLGPKGLAEALTTALEVAPPEIPDWAQEPTFPFELLSPLARGGQGEVWKALTRDEREPVAIKVVHLPSNSTTFALQRFREEVQTLRSLNHPHIISLIAHGEVPGAQAGWLAMPWIEGGSLADLARSSSTSLTWETLRPLSLQACRALQELHQKGFVHRDLNPSNFLVNAKQSHLWLSDFGMTSREGSKDPGQTQITPYTPGYCAPELLEGRTKASPASDQFSLAATLWHLLTGRLPLGELRKPETPLPPGLEGVLRKALASRSEDRFPDLREFEQALTSPPRNHRRLLASLMVILGLPVFSLWPSAQTTTPTPALPDLPPSQTFESARIPVTGNDKAFVKITAVIHRKGRLEATYQIENESLLQGVTVRTLLRFVDDEGNEIFAILSDPLGVNGILIPGMENTRTEYRAHNFDPNFYPKIHEIRFDAHEALHAAEDRTKALWRDIKRDLKKITE